MLGDRYRIAACSVGAAWPTCFGDDLLLERAVAIKILNANLCEDPTGLERFRREAITLAAVRSPHIVGIYDIGREREGDCVYLVMQHIEGKTLFRTARRP